MTAVTAPLIEVFASVQGEGRHVGMPMAFVRTARCPIRCRYCDTPHSYDVPARLTVKGKDAVREEANPVDVRRAAELVAEVMPAGGRAVSVTGGEPLLHADFVGELGAVLHEGGLRLHLETAALDPRALARCIGSVDHVSADWKLPGTLERGAFEPRHRACLDVALAEGATVDVKLVLTHEVAPAAVEAALAELAALRDRVVLVLQPVTPFGAVHERLPAERLRAAWQQALAFGFDVRVLPQVHRVLGVE